jgi:hypothetical protein
MAEIGDENQAGLDGVCRREAAIRDLPNRSRKRDQARARAQYSYFLPAYLRISWASCRLQTAKEVRASIILGSNDSVVTTPRARSATLLPTDPDLDAPTGNAWVDIRLSLPLAHQTVGRDAICH